MLHNGYSVWSSAHMDEFILEHRSSWSPNSLSGHSSLNTRIWILSWFFETSWDSDRFRGQQLHTIAEAPPTWTTCSWNGPSLFLNDLRWNAWCAPCTAWCAPCTRLSLSKPRWSSVRKQFLRSKRDKPPFNPVTTVIFTLAYWTDKKRESFEVRPDRAVHPSKALLIASAGAVSICRRGMALLLIFAIKFYDFNSRI